MASARKADLKQETLKKQGALNPHPLDVVDELFAASRFFDPRDLVQVKYEMLRRVEKDGWPVTKSAQGFGFSRVAFYRALAAFRNAGIPGLIPLRRGPRHAHKLSADVVEYAREALTRAPSLSAADLPPLIKKRFGISIHRRSIERALKRAEKGG
jgi:transposase